MPDGRHDACATAVRGRNPVITVILNPSSGSIRSKSPIDTELRQLFREAGHDVVIIPLAPGQSATDVAREASRNASIVVAAGGDGTVSRVTAGILGSQAALGILPLGTLNHFAKDLGIPLGLHEAVAVVAAGHVQCVDVGQVNDRPFINNSSIGIYPDIVHTREELRQSGHRKWTAMALATLRVLRRYRGVTVAIDVDGDVRTWRTPFVFVGNNEYAIDGRRIGARSRLDAGRLFVYLSPRMRSRDLPMLLAKALLGRAGRSGAFEIVSATDLRIHTRKATRRVAFDGEVARMSTPLRYRISSRALRVVLPHP